MVATASLPMERQINDSAFPAISDPMPSWPAGKQCAGRLVQEGHGPCQSKECTSIASVFDKCLTGFCQRPNRCGSGIAVRQPDGSVIHQLLGDPKLHLLGTTSSPTDTSTL